jgi:hypothetical protein
MYVFILGLDHSRSTILDLALGEKLGALSLGEVRRTAFPRGGEVSGRQDCSCGAAFANCPVWQNLADDFETQATAMLAAGQILIDSSKDLAHYRRFVGTLVPHVTLVTYRKFDDWYRSILAAAAREDSFSPANIFRDRRFVLAGLRLFLRRFRPIARVEWMMTHLRFMRAVRGQAYLIASSQDFHALAEKLGRDDGSAKYQPAKHIVRGNRVARSGDVTLQAFDENDGFSRFLKSRIEKSNADSRRLEMTA